VLFNLDMDIGGGRTRRICVREGADLRELSEQFVRDNNLQPGAIPRVAALLQQNLEMHRSQESGRQFR
jgi:hypothetical protein